MIEPKRSYSNSTTAFPKHCDYACALECGKPHGHGKWMWSIVFLLALVSFTVIMLSVEKI